MNVIGHIIIDGVPHINGKSAVWDENNSFPDIFSSWKCPECNANLSKDDQICLNACHLTVPQYLKLKQGLIEAQRRVEFKESRPDIVNWIEDD